MSKRTTIEIDADLLTDARKALGDPTTRAAVEEALRRAVARTDDVQTLRRRLQLDYLASLGNHVDLDILSSDKMWQ
jgi:Arc/MetJ family transcription regulator